MASEQPKAEKPAAKPTGSKPVAASDTVQLEQAARAIGEVARREAEKKNAPKPKIVQAADLPVVEVTAKRYEWFEYNTGMRGDEQGARIKFHPTHSNGGTQDSKLLRDKTTGFEAVYGYRFQPNYVGKDSVELEYSDHRPGNGPDDPGTMTITSRVSVTRSSAMATWSPPTPVVSAATTTQP